MAAVALLFMAGPTLAAETHPPRSPRDFYNEGTLRLREGRLRDAEAALQTAVVGDQQNVTPSALYNLGWVRFQQGLDALKEAPKVAPAMGRSQAARESAGQAIKTAEAALASQDLEAIARAYLRGRGARKEIKAAIEAIKKAMEAHGAVLSRWQRASGDFKSADELRPGYDDARTNAAAIDQRIAALVDQQEMMSLAMEGMGQQRQDLKGLMQQLRKMMPKEQGGQGEKEEDDEEEDDEDQQEPKQGSQEKESKEGKEMALTWETALRLLESLRLDANRKLPMGEDQTGAPKDRKGKDW